MPEIFDHPDEEFVTIIEDNIDALQAVMLDASRKVLPWDQFLRSIDYARRHHPRAYVIQQFNCRRCGARQTIPDPDHLFMEGHCEECDAVTDCTVDGAWAVGLEVQEGKEPLLRQFLDEMAAKPDAYLSRPGRGG